MPNGVVTSYTYDMHDRLTTLVTKNASGDVLSAFRYHLDPVGNRTGMDLNQNGATNYIRYGFDGAYRLTSETRKNEAGAVVYSESFDYDAVGNRIRQVKNGEASVYTYNRNNQLEEILANGKTVKHAYDKNGNLIRKRGPGVNETYKYDELNRMTEFASRGKGKPRIERHTYRGAEWHRASTTVDGTTTRYLYDGDNVVADLQDGNGVALYVTPFLDQNLSVAKDGAMHYYSHDGLGSVRLLTDAAGNIENAYDYTAFGETYAPNTVNSIENRYTYTGRESSSVGAPMYYRYRMYDAAVGRFTARDPIYTRGGVNLYAYVRNQPHSFADPRGLKWETTNCRQVDFEFVGFEGYFLIGAGFSVTGSRIVCDCCDVKTGKTVIDDYVDINFSVSGTTGFGIGSKANILGLRLDLILKGPQFVLDLNASFLKECGKKAAQVNPKANFNGDLTLNGGATEILGLYVEAGGKLTGEYGFRLSRDSGEFYIKGGWDYGIWVTPVAGPFQVPIKVTGDAGGDEDKINWSLY